MIFFVFMFCLFLKVLAVNLRFLNDAVLYNLLASTCHMTPYFMHESWYERSLRARYKCDECLYHCSNESAHASHLEQYNLADWQDTIFMVL